MLTCNSYLAFSDVIKHCLSFPVLKNGKASVNTVTPQMNGSAADDDWLVIGGKNKGVVTRSVSILNHCPPSLTKSFM